MTVLDDDELAAVARYLREGHVDLAGDLTATPISGGRSNLTYQLTDGHARWVLRMPPRVGRTPSAHDVEREFRVTQALSTTDVPVARPIAFCKDESLVGAPFLVSQFVSGASVQSAADLDALDDHALGLAVSGVLAALTSLHGVDYQAVGLDEFGRSDGYAARQLRRWTGQWELVASDDAETRRAAAALASRLTDSVPEQRSSTIVHGDYRIDNTLLHLGDTPRVLAIVDWELSTIGDPVADVALMCAYRHPALDLVQGKPSSWTSARLPSPHVLAGQYEAAGGVSLADWDFHLALAYFKIAVIAAGIDFRFRAGSGSGPGFSTARDAVLPFMSAGLEASAALAR